MHSIARILAITLLITTFISTYTMFDKGCEFGTGSRINAISLIADGSLLALCFETGGSKILNLNNACRYSLNNHNENYTDTIAFAHTATPEQSVALGFSTEKGKYGLAIYSSSNRWQSETTLVESHLSYTSIACPTVSLIAALKYSPDDRVIATGQYNGAAQSYDPATLQKMSNQGSTRLYTEPVTALNFIDTTTLSIVRGSAFSFFDIRSKSVSFEQHLASRISCIATDPIKRPMEIALAAHDCTVKLWDLRKQKALWNVTLDARTSSLALAPQNKSILTGDTRGELRTIVNGTTYIRHRSKAIEGPHYASRICGISPSCDGMLVASASHKYFKICGTEKSLEKIFGAFSREIADDGRGESKKIPREL